MCWWAAGVELQVAGDAVQQVLMVAVGSVVLVISIGRLQEAGADQRFS